MQVQEFVALSIARNNSFSVWRWLDECAFLALTTAQMVQETSFAECVQYVQTIIPESYVLPQSQTPWVVDIHRMKHIAYSTSGQ